MCKILQHDACVRCVRELIFRFLNNVEQITPYICCFEIINDTLITCTLGYCIIMVSYQADFKFRLRVYHSCLRNSVVVVVFTGMGKQQHRCFNCLHLVADEHHIY